MRNPKFAIPSLLLVCLFQFGTAGASVHEFVEKPKNITTTEGLNILLRCKVANLRTHIAWMKNSVPLTLGEDRELPTYPRYRIEGNAASGESHLRISDVKLSDEGFYECQVRKTLESPQLRGRAYLTVVVPPPPPTIHGHFNGSEVAYNNSQLNLVLRCSSGYSKPPALITWMKGGVEIGPSYVGQAHTYNNNLTNTQSTLTFQPVPEDDNLLITCVSTHEAFTMNYKSTNVRLIVYYPPSRLEISGNNEDTLLKAGRMLVLTCTAIGGNPLPNLTWRKENVIMPDQKQTISGSRVTSQINFVVSAIDNGASLICESSSRASESVSVTTTLRVLFPPTRLSVNANLMGRTMAQENRELTVTCNTNSSNPSSKISWYLVRKHDPSNHEELKDSNHVISNGIHQGYTTISEVRIIPRLLDHEAKVVCRAENEKTGDHITESVVLNVAYHPRFISPKNFTVVEGHQASMFLHIDANPRVNDIKWMKENREVGMFSSRQPSKFVQGDVGLSGGLRMTGEIFETKNPLEFIHGGRSYQEVRFNISQVNRDDAGLYSVQAMNSEGTGNVAVYLDVYYSAFTTKISRDVTATEGSPVTLECFFSGNPLPTSVKWYRNGIQVTGRRDETQITNTADPQHRDQGSSKLNYFLVRQEDMGVHQCEVNNGIGQSSNRSRQIRLVVEHTPKIDKSLLYKRSAAPVNGTATLKCKAHGIPHVSFAWNKINDSLPHGRYETHDNAHVTLDDSQVLLPSNHTYESVLHLQSVQPKDYGYYYCRATNVHGADDFKIFLGKPGPPDCPYDIQVLNVTHDGITLSFRKGFSGGSKQFFTIKHGEYDGGDESVSGKFKEKNITSELETLETVIYSLRGLRLGTNYWIAVSSYNRHGRCANPSMRPITASTSTAPPAGNNNRSSTNSEVSIIVYAFITLTAILVVAISAYFLIKRRSRCDKGSRTMSGGNNMGKSSKVSSVETTTTNGTLDLIGTPSLVDDVQFKTIDSYNSSNANFIGANLADYGRTLTLIPKYGCGYDRVSQTHSICDVSKCTEFRPGYGEEDGYAGHSRAYHSGYTPTNSLLSASRTKITSNPLHLIPSTYMSNNPSDGPVNRQNSNQGSDSTGSPCYVPMNSCMTSSSVMPDLHANTCAYRPGRDMYQCNTVSSTRGYTPDHRPLCQTPTSNPSYYGVPPELRGHLV